MLKISFLSVAITALCSNKVHSFANNAKSVQSVSKTQLNASRRNFMEGAFSFGSFLAVASTNPTKANADPENLNAFNSLTFNYRKSEFGGLDASTIEEPTMTYNDFLAKLGAGEVDFVKFYAPDGDVAYATLKSTSKNSEDGSEVTSLSKPIRIGEGYPIEQHDGWSSPAFVIRSVKDKGVPYKFVLPALDNYK